MTMRNLIAAALLFSLVSPAAAQNNSSGQTGAERTIYNRGTPQRPVFMPKPSQNHTVGSLKYDYLKKAPDSLPAMSAIAPNGSSFCSGMKNVSESGITNLQLRYNAAGDTRTVLDFYGQQFRQPGWRVNSFNQSQLNATYAGNNVTVMVLPPSNPKFHCDVQITYSMAPNR